MRRATATIIIQGKDVTTDVTPHLLSLSYTDKADDELDDLTLTLEDREHLWQGDWLPKPGETLSAIIRAQGFPCGERSELDCGNFEVDEVTLDTTADGGDVVSVKATPAVARSSLMLERKTRAWADISLARIAADIFNAAGLDLLYKAPELIFGRVEQRQESDLAFMQRVTKEQGLRLALKKDRAVIYSGQTADALEPLEVKRGEFALSSASFKRTLDAVYTQCVLGYTDADSSASTDESFKPELPPTSGKTLTLNQRIENPAQAERVAKAELRAKNCQEMTCRIDCMGDTRLLAGSTLRLTGWGGFDGTYVISQASHSLSRESYRTSVELVKALEY